jgi:hypothetical protein
MAVVVEGSAVASGQQGPVEVCGATIPGGLGARL